MKFDIQVVENTITQSALLHDDIPGYNLPTLEFVLPPEDDDKDLILKEEIPEIYAHLENVLVHLIEVQDIAIFKSKRDYVRKNKSFGIYMIFTNLASHVSHLLLCSLYMQHLNGDNTDCILYKIPKDNVSYAYGIYNYKHEQFWHPFH